MDFEEKNLIFSATKSFRYCVYGDFSVLIEGHKGLKTLNSNKMEFRLGKYGTITVQGESLAVVQMTKHYVLISGKISGVKHEKGKD